MHLSFLFQATTLGPSPFPSIHSPRSAVQPLALTQGIFERLGRHELVVRITRELSGLSNVGLDLFDDLVVLNISEEGSGDLGQFERGGNIPVISHVAYVDVPSRLGVAARQSEEAAHSGNWAREKDTGFSLDAHGSDGVVASDIVAVARDTRRLILGGTFTRAVDVRAAELGAKAKRVADLPRSAFHYL